MNIKSNLGKINLNQNNSIVIGSGILNALSIRKIKDIDLVVDSNAYIRLSSDKHFEKSENHGQEILTDELFEIGRNWDVMGKNRNFKDFLPDSIVINDVRYITLQFLLDVKKSWVKDKDVRQKDIDDIELIENYLKR